MGRAVRLKCRGYIVFSLTVVETVALLISTLLLSALSIHVMAPVAVKLGLTDKPGGRKHHEHATPLVGGIAIYLSLLVSGLLLKWYELGDFNFLFIAAGGALVLTGLIDDYCELSIRIRMGVQALASLVMILMAGIVLNDLGAIVSTDLLMLGYFAVPITILGVVAITNALNMMDGIDGLAGAVSCVCLGLLLSVAMVSGSVPDAILIVSAMGAVLGFLLFNFHWFGIRKAHVFLGDSGSTMLGFLFAWLLISLSQGEGRAMQPVTALWIFAVPLMDLAGLIIRRLWLKRSPFKADRGHLHHLLLDAGFRVRQAVVLIAAIQVLLGLIGLMGLYLDIPDRVMFISFLLLFSLYCYLIIRPWRVVPRLRYVHQCLSLTVRGCDQVYVGNLDIETAIENIEQMINSLNHDHTFRVYEYSDKQTDRLYCFAVIDIHMTDNMSKVCRQLVRSKFSKPGFIIRKFIVRNPDNDRRKVVREGETTARLGDRRSAVISEVKNAVKKSFTGQVLD